jgi:hypothetical protein
MNPRMAIMGAFQILWIYYGLLIASRPVILWNVFAVLINSLSVGAYFYFVHEGKKSDRLRVSARRHQVSDVMNSRRKLYWITADKSPYHK